MFRTLLNYFGFIANQEYVAQRSLLVDVDKGIISREELFARGEVLFEERLEGALVH